MTAWQQRARFVVAVFGLAAAVVVYFAIGRRPPPSSPAPVKRIDPKATAESIGGNFNRFRSGKRDFVISYGTQLTYPDGSTRMSDVTVNVTKDDGRNYIVKAGEALATQDQKVMQLSAGVTMKAADGFEMATDHASYDKDQGTIHSDVPVSFSKGRMRGSGSTVDYNETTKILKIGKDAHVASMNEEGNTALEFTAGTAVLDRLQHVLTLEGHVHVLRDAQVMDADRSTSRLSANDDVVTFVELRGNARVQGGSGTLDSMNARDIDLDYTDDGAALERVALNGNASITMTGTNGASGRQFAGESLNVELAPDGAVTAAIGRDNVRMVLPAGPDAPARSIRGRALHATGMPGQGLTAARFTENVEYREKGTGTAPARAVRSRRLDVVLASDEVSDASFTGEVTFEEPAFRAQAANARYSPSAGTLHLTGSDTRGLPCLADDQISVDAQTIDVAVESRKLTAIGRVKTSLRPSGASRAVGSSPCAIARQRSSAPSRAAADDSSTRLPGLLKQDQVAVATADNLEYAGTGKPLVYTGTATLVQGETSLRGDRIRIDQEQGDLVVTGGARSLIVQGTGDAAEKVDGRAEEIRYTDARRLVQYLSTPSGTATPAGTAEGPAPGKLVRVNGPQGDLSAGRVDVVLNKEDGRAEQLEAYRTVTAKIGTRTATADRLTYLAKEEQYDMRGAGTLPVVVADGCLTASGRTLTLFKSNNRMIVDGRDVMRTRTQSAACQPSSGSPR